MDGRNFSHKKIVNPFLICSQFIKLNLNAKSKHGRHFLFSRKKYQVLIS